MSVQFNLLPDVKIEYDRVRRNQLKILSLATMITIVLFGIFLVFFLSVNGVQKKMLSDSDKDIQSYSQKLKSLPDLQKIITVQNQLNTLPSLHQQKHITSRLFNYLPQLVPSTAGVSKMSLDVTNDTLTIVGNADNVETVNKFVDTIKFTTYKVDNGGSEKNAFTNVVLDSISRDEKGASFSISANYDPALFDSSQNITLVVPKKYTTRSVSSTPGIDSTLFNGTAKPTTNTTNTTNTKTTNGSAQ